VVTGRKLDALRAPDALGKPGHAVNRTLASLARAS
jgi:hypothetical protein